MTTKWLILFSIFSFQVQFLSLLLLSSCFALPSSDHALLNKQVQQLLMDDNEELDRDTVKHLLETIINNRQYYSNDIIAKVYLLSAREASNQGNINQVFEFTQSGLATNSLDKPIKLALLLKLADVYIARKQYKRLLDVTQIAVNNSQHSNSVKYQLLSLSYRSVAFAMLGKHQQSLVDLQQVEQGISESELTEHIELLTILSLAYHHLGDYQTSRIMQLKILKLSVETGQKRNVAQTYLYLGYAYMNLQRFDDAYNAFWQAKKYAEENGVPIHVAHANKGLGLALLKQKQFTEALSPLKKATEIFDQYNIISERIETSVALASVKLNVKQTIEGYALLVEIITLLDGKDISLKYAGFYRMVAEMHFVQKNYQTAYRWQEKHSQVLLDKLRHNKKSSQIVQIFPHLALGQALKVGPVEESKRLAVKLAESSDLSIHFAEKYQKQRAIIISLSVLVCLLLLSLVGFFLRLRAQKMNQAYEEIEKPNYAMAAPLQTKFAYQLAFKKAKKFQYSLSVGYLIIDNWQELIFHFKRKSISEVNKDIASLINEQITEFDYGGLLNDGEYLLLFEHQTKQEASVKLDKIVQTINATAFTNLGGGAVTIKYSLNTPDFKDIEPYLFLARISESVNIMPVNPSKVS